MKYLLIISYSLLALLGSVNTSVGQDSMAIKRAAIWKKISPYFSPPEKYKGKYGHYRSSLKFYNGDTVKTVQDWKKRRKEIRTRWMHMMGKWPPLLKNQKLEIAGSIHRDGFTQYVVRFNWLPHQQTEGYLLIPDGRGKKPAVITVFYAPQAAVGWENGWLMKFKNLDYAYQLAKRGFVTLSLGIPNSLYYPSIENSGIEPLSAMAYASANAWYAFSKVPQVDSTRIGIIGHSYGGKWAMFASCLFNKFAAAVWSDPGIVFDETKGNYVNYWEPWYLGYYPPPWSTDRKKGMIPGAKGLYPKLVKEGYDLQELHALMAPRPFLVSGGYSDPPKRWIPLNQTIAVNHLLGYNNRVALTNVRTQHNPTPKSNKIVYLFFEYFLKYNGLSVK
jgi:hypothetical protein